MGFTIRPYKGKKLMVDFRYSVADGSRRRDRKIAPTTSRPAAERWAADRLTALIRGETVITKEVKTLAEFEPTFIERYAKGNNQKHSSVVTKESVFKVHLVPAFGKKKLDAITTADVDELKAALLKKGRSAKRINDILTVLRTALRTAVRYGEMTASPADVVGLPLPESEMSFYDEAELARLLEAAKFVDERAHLVVLLGADAGLRAGEMLPLEWGDLDTKAGLVTIRRAEWRGVVGSTKNGKKRTVEMTDRLRAALAAYRHMRGKRVFYRDGAELRTVTLKIVETWVAASLRLAQFGKPAAVHALRHTFGTRLAASGATAKEIQELMGHKSLRSTFRYLHFVPGARAQAIDRLQKVGNRRATPS